MRSSNRQGVASESSCHAQGLLHELRHDVTVGRRGLDCAGGGRHEAGYALTAGKRSARAANFCFFTCRQSHSPCWLLPMVSGVVTTCPRSHSRGLLGGEPVVVFVVAVNFLECMAGLLSGQLIMVFFMSMMSSALMRTSVAVPPMPPEGWCMSTRRAGRVTLLPLVRSSAGLAYRLPHARGPRSPRQAR